MNQQKVTEIIPLTSTSEQGLELAKDTNREFWAWPVSRIDVIYPRDTDVEYTIGKHTGTFQNLFYVSDATHKDKVLKVLQKFSTPRYARIEPCKSLLDVNELLFTCRLPSFTLTTSSNELQIVLTVHNVELCADV